MSVSDGARDAAGQGRLDPAVLDRLQGLELVARTVVEGFMSGHHRSPFRGSSSEFAQHRQYVHGDDPRNLDWKVYARTDRLVVKEFVEETTLDCHLLVDASESMRFGSLGWSKFDFARWGAAALAHLVLSRRDTAGLVLFGESERIKVPPGNGGPQKHAIFHALDEAKPAGATAVGKVLEWVASRLHRRGIVAVFSDFFDDPESIVTGLRRLAHAGHEPILFQIVDPLELSFDIQQLTRLDGLEASGQQKVDPRALRSAYRDEIEAHNRELARQASKLSLDFVQLETSQPLEAVLSSYLGKRTARNRGGGL